MQHADETARVLQIRALLAQGRNGEADALIDDVSRQATQPETVLTAKAFAAGAAMQ